MLFFDLNDDNAWLTWEAIRDAGERQRGLAGSLMLINDKVWLCLNGHNPARDGTWLVVSQKISIITCE